MLVRRAGCLRVKSLPGDGQLARDGPPPWELLADRSIAAWRLADPAGIEKGPETTVAVVGGLVGSGVLILSWRDSVVGRSDRAPSLVAAVTLTTPWRAGDHGGRHEAGDGCSESPFSHVHCRRYVVRGPEVPAVPAAVRGSRIWVRGICSLGLGIGRLVTRSGVGPPDRSTSGVGKGTETWSVGLVREACEWARFSRAL